MTNRWGSDRNPKSNIHEMMRLMAEQSIATPSNDSSHHTSIVLANSSRMIREMLQRILLRHPAIHVRTEPVASHLVETIHTFQDIDWVVISEKQAVLLEPRLPSDRPIGVLELAENRRWGVVAIKDHDKSVHHVLDPLRLANVIQVLSTKPRDLLYTM